MILRDVAQWLLDNKYAVLVNGEFTITNKLTKELKLADVKVTKKGYGTDEGRRDEWARFVADAEIPQAAMTREGRYWLRPFSNEGVMQLLRVLNTPGVQRSILVASTRKYYKEAAFKKTLLNYLQDELWREMYSSYNNTPEIEPGANPFEK